MNFKNFENKRGITLIALVITIIVLLILAGITINLTIGQDGIITTAQEAGRNYTQAYENEQAQLDELNSDVNELITSLTSEKKVDRTGLKVGDYIDYTPDTATGTVYDKSKLDVSITGGSSNTDDLTMDDLNWQILRIYDDGSIDLIGSVTSKDVYFKGALGYNNGVYVMNDICKTLYSRSSAGITARSVKIEDIEYWLKEDEDGKTAKDKYESVHNRKVGDTETFTGHFSRYPALWAKQTGTIVNGTEKTRGISQSDNGYTSVTTETYLPENATDSDSITVKQTAWDADFNETNFGTIADTFYSSTKYWIASRCAYLNSNHTDFALFTGVTCVSGLSNDVMCSDTLEANRNARLRPVVHLKSSTQIEVSSTPRYKSTPHHIVSY